MGITALDIKIRKSQRLTDNPDGGGRMVAAEVVDGELNNLFPDISTQDRVSGRVSMRKAFVHVDTANTDTLYGAVGVVMEPPADDNVSMTMFSTGSYADVRSDARNRIESYITRGVESRYVLFGDHFIGQRSVTVYCMKDAPTPEINETLCLSIEAEGYPALTQYLRVEEVVSRTTQTFYHDLAGNIGAFDRDVVIFNTTTALLHDFPGQEVIANTSIKPPTRVRLTNVADASSYYGVRPLTLPAAIGDLLVKVDSPYVSLVPATQAETPMVDILAGLGTVSLVQAGAADLLSDSTNAAFNAGVAVTRFLGSPLAKGSVTVTVAGTTLHDDGRGDLVADAGASPWGGAVDYISGSVSVVNSGNAGSASVTITATPAGAVSAQGFSDRIAISNSNRQNNYVFQLAPLPSAGTATVDYRALGKWIRLTDTGTGQLRGEAGQGSGTVNYATGSITVTLGALPDLDSEVIVSWGTGVQTSRRDGDAAIEPPALQYTLPHTGLVPGSVTVTWLVNDTPVSATDDGAGTLTQGATPVGSIVYATGNVTVRPATLPDANSSVTTDYTWAPVQNESFTMDVDAGGNASFDLGGAIRPGTLRLVWSTHVPAGTSATGHVTRTVNMTARDDGNGNLVGVSVGGTGWGVGVIGSIDNATGVGTVKVGNHQLAYWTPVYVTIAGLGGGGEDRWTVEDYQFRNQVTETTDGTPLAAEWLPASASDTAATDTIALPPVELDLTPTVIDAIVPGSVRFDFRGLTYVDRSGSLYHSIDPASGSGTYAGTIDYASGLARITAWQAGGANTVAVTALLSRFSEPGQDSIHFRTPGSPLRPGSFTLRVNKLDGTQLTATADINGVITGTEIAGEIDWQSGAAYVRFGQMVPAAGNELEPWYDPAAVVDGNVWRPTLVIPDTAFIGVVVYRSIPLNPSLLGLDPVRLPQDGRVVVFRPGQTALVHHTQVTEIAAPTAGQIVNFGRPNVSRVEVRDSAGTPVDSIWYVIDKPAGTLTFADPLNLSSYVLPIVVRDRIEDRVLVADSQITGEIAINRQLAHDYPDGGYLSTCLILGEMNGSQDLQARVENLFDQATWTSEFSDERIGDGTDAQYNDVVYPLQVDNANTITERWAIHFTNSTMFEVIGEASGIIATGDTTADCAPPNPRTGLPYFTLPAAGWGSGWSAGNVLRFNTIGGLAPVWFIRTTLAGEMEAPYDGFRFEAIGDANP